MSGLIHKFTQRFPLIASLFTNRLKLSLAVLATVFVLTAWSQYALLLSSADGLFTLAGPIIGADFFVFYRAALVAGGPDMVNIYEMSKFSAILKEAYPGHGDMLFGWQYPPTMSLLIKPLAAAPYLWSFALWVLALGVLFIATLWKLWPNRIAIFFAIGSPAVFYSIITGQTGLLTGSLFALSIHFAATRPAVAGTAAALLTVKPQLGLLIPIAYAAAGRWRAFGFAALVIALLVGASIAAHGVDPWQAFFHAIAAHGDRMGAEGGFPAHKLITPFGAASLLGAPKSFALLLQACASFALIAFVALIWRRVSDIDLRLAILGTAAPLATPYAFYYEAAFLVPPLFVLAKHASQNGWMKGERSSLIAIWAATLFLPGRETIPSFPVSFSISLAAFVIAARRALPAAGVSLTRADARRFPFCIDKAA